MTTSSLPDHAARLRVSRALANSDIEPARMPASAILIVRSVRDPLPGRVQVLDGPTGVSEGWQRAMRAELTDAWRDAARPALRRVPPGAPAVFFANPAELLAAFALDARAGRVSSRWWWTALSRGWAGKRAPGLADLWVREARHVPAALAWLDARGSASTVVAAFTPDEAAAVLAALSTVFRLPHPLQPGRSVVHPSATHHAPAHEEGEAASKPLTASPEHRAAPAPWRSFLPASAVPSALLPDLQVLLGVGLLLHRAPLIPRREAFASAVLRWRAEAGGGLRGREIHGVASPTPAGRLTPRDARWPGTKGDARAPRSHPRAMVATDAARTAPVASPTGDLSPAPDRARSARPTTPDPPRRSETPARGTSGTATTGESPQPGQEPASLEPGRSAALEVHSRLCGVFFLIQALRAEAWFLRADAALPTPSLTSGWNWVELVARRLLGRRATLDDPVWRVLGVLAGREAERGRIPPVRADPPTRAFLGGALPPFRARLTTALAAAGTKEALHDALFCRTGLVQASVTHVDVRMDLDQVTLPVRIAGLDVNPGWVPELARVVTFHFG